ncbi:MAG: NADPH-dependent oxidoreductase [Proteobacteria bacterium]|nr:NADPH-dependent oxidoreductase [Pseudomonadota bacterium]
MTKPLLIFGSARSDGGTKTAVDMVTSRQAVEFIDLAEQNIGAYDYQNRNQSDDFIKIAEKMTKTQVIIFATPVYWYAMSGSLKTFFDRFTDLITVRKDLGRALKGQKCYMICAGASEHMPEGFEYPFKATCDYLKMEYKGGFYFHTGKNEKLVQEAKETAKSFSATIFSQS